MTAEDHQWAWQALPGFHLAEWSSELAGTAILLFIGVSAISLDFGPGSPVARAVPSTSLRLLFTGMLFAGSGSLVAVSPLGRRSGAHLNPAVTFAFWLTRHVHPHDLGGYVCSQCLGALAGTFLAALAWNGTAAAVGFARTVPGRGLSPTAAAGIEAAMTALLVLTIFSFVSSRRTMRWTPIAVWVLVSLLVWQGAPLTGTSLNPARSLGPALVGGSAGELWVYFAGPLAGAAAAVALAYIFSGGRRLLTAKLFHDPGYPCVFKTSKTIAPG